MNAALRSVPLLFVLSAFGPYVLLGAGVKLDNLVIYPAGLLLVLLTLASGRIRYNPMLGTLFLIWGTAFLFLASRTFLSLPALDFTSVIAELKNFTQPWAIMAVFLLLPVFDREGTERVIKRTCQLLVLLLALNTLWIFVGFAADVSAINRWFWREYADQVSVASLAMQNGRYSGIFNQPFEAGIAYSLGIVAWLYLLDRNAWRPGFRTLALLLLLVIGGLLTVSKVFLFLGLPLLALGVLSSKRIWRRLLFAGLLFAPITYFSFRYLTETWGGADYLLRFFDESARRDGWLSLLTAGRFGGTSSQQSSYFARIYDSHPLIGEGLGSQKIYDSAFFHFFSAGGSIGLVFYFLLLLFFIWKLFDFYQHAGLSSEFKLLLGVVLVIFVGSFGAPVLTINRSSVLIWVLVCLSLLYFQHVKAEKVPVSERRGRVG